MATSLKAGHEHRRRARQRALQHERACLRARRALESAGWRIRVRGEADLMIEREGFNRDGSDSVQRLFGKDEVELLKRTLRPRNEPRWHR